MAYGIEVEFFIPRDDLRRNYFNLTGHIFNSKLGIDGSTELTCEYRSDPKENLDDLFDEAIKICKDLGMAFHAQFIPYAEYNCNCCNVTHKIPMGIHFSISRPVNPLIVLKFYLLYKRIDREIAEYFSFHYFYLFRKRKKYYPDFMRVHKRRIEFRFFPNDIYFVREKVKEILK